MARPAGERKISAPLVWFGDLSPTQQTLLVLLCSFILLVACAPMNFVHGFLDREEGTTYLRYAHMAAPLNSFLAPHQQYYAIYPNVTTLVGARVLPLRFAAIFGVWASVLVHLLTAYTVWMCERFRDLRTRLLATLAILLAPGMAIVMVGNTQTQFGFALQCVVILLCDPDRHRLSRSLSVVLGGLDGVVSCVLTPFFLYRAFRTRSPTAWLQACFLTACTAMQLIVLRHALPFSGRGDMPLRPWFVYADGITTHLLLLPFATRFVYHAALQMTTPPTGVLIAVGCVGLALVAMLLWLVWPAGALARGALALAVFHACCSMPGIMGPDVAIWGGGERYYFVACGAMALALLLAWQSEALTPRRHRCVAVLLGLILFSGVVDMARYWRLNQSGPVWADQLAVWQKDPEHTTLTANPEIWGKTFRYLMPPERTSIDAPFYIYDSDPRPGVLERLPRDWFGPHPTTSYAR